MGAAVVGVKPDTQDEDQAGAGQADQPEGGNDDELIALAQQLDGEAQSGHKEAARQLQAAADSELQVMTAELRDALGLARMMVAPMFAWWPDFGTCWSDAQLQTIASSGAAVMQRHGLSMGEVMTKWGPYVALGVATLPPSIATVQAVKARNAAERAARQAPRREPMQAPPPAPAPAQGHPQEGVRL